MQEYLKMEPKIILYQQILRVNIAFQHWIETMMDSLNLQIVAEWLLLAAW